MRNNNLNPPHRLFRPICALLLCLFLASGSLLAQNITLNMEKASIKTILREIQTQTTYKFVYNEALMEVETITSLSVKNEPLESVLKKLFQNQGISYQIVDSQIVLFPYKPASTTPQKQSSIQGIIKDENDKPLPDATVLVKGTRLITTTGVAGNFSFSSVDPNATLIVSFIGYMPIEYNLNGRTTVELTLLPDAQTLENVVVTGYQTISKAKITGATATVTSAALSTRYTPDITRNLEGRVAGLVNYGGKITIRGTSSLFAETKPLLVIDGLPIETDLEDLNPYDIESVTVLKDAATAAIYGARASNGVIVVVTKKAAEHNKVEVDVSANLTVFQKRNLDYADNFYMTPAQQVDLESDYYRWFYNTAQAAAANRTNTANAIAFTASTNLNITPVQYAYYQLAMGAINQNEVDNRLAQYRTQNFGQDFADQILLNRMLQQYNVSVRNRTNNFQSNLVVNFKNDNNGIVKDKNNQYNIFYKGSYDMTKWMTINFSVNSILQQTNSSNSEHATNPFNVPAYYSLFNPDQSYASLVPGTTGTGVIYWNNYTNFLNDKPWLRSMHFNHRQELDFDRRITQRQNQRYHGELLIKIITGLTIHTQFIYETNRFTSSAYSQAESFIMRWLRNVYTVPNGSTYTYMIPETGGKLVSQNTRGDAWTTRGQLNFSRVLAKNHSVVFLAGLEFRETFNSGTQNLMLGWDDQLQSHATTLVNFPNLQAFATTSYFAAGFPARNNAYTPYLQSVIRPITETQHRNASGYANLTYTYKDRYNAFASIRKDFADVYGLATEFRGVPFWSAGASWNIDQEAFMSEINAINGLKLRTNYGYTGNIYQGATSYMTATTTSRNQFNSLPYATILSPSNPELSWERTGTFNLGVDFALFNYRLRGALDWYNKKSDKIFSKKSLESTFGFTSLVMNMANIVNNGVELTLAYDWFRPQDRSGLAWTTSITASRNKNEVTLVETQATTAWDVIDIGFKQGYPVNPLFSYVFAGLHTDGQQTWKAANGNTIIGVGIQSQSPESVVYSGQADPVTTFAMENHFTWSGFSLNVMMVYYGGHKMRALQIHPGISPAVRPMPSYLVDAWTPEHTETNVPGFGEYNATMATSVSVPNNTDIFVRPADFIKIRNIVLGYDLPRVLVSNLGLSSLSLRFQIDNLAPLWTKNTIGVDPETLGLRLPTSYIFGLNFRF